MKFLIRPLQVVILCVLSLSVVSCESSKPKKRKPVSVSEFDQSSSLPWNRPRSFESGGGLGRMMPQSR
ncbi:hypothetical protein FEM03_08830 [Phragmitibacter flavus]|uniref:Uncharacterized protein n=1 Tax=Phragmitibacter flavus TaxID=2576071 RepID=A0A5R8KFE4_9BACT|nr:hypothetical protein [Phragmitibacter flavus]TLD71012.1 hypothetical protein FEM03_08830 [Phragmitibacter flavus]